jgi:hypothetical protein
MLSDQMFEEAPFKQLILNTKTGQLFEIGFVEVSGMYVCKKLRVQLFKSGVLKG